MQAAKICVDLTLGDSDEDGCLNASKLNGRAGHPKRPSMAGPTASPATAATVNPTKTTLMRPPTSTPSTAQRRQRQATLHDCMSPRSGVTRALLPSPGLSIAIAAAASPTSQPNPPASPAPPTPTTAPRPDSCNTPAPNKTSLLNAPVPQPLHPPSVPPSAMAASAPMLHTPAAAGGPSATRMRAQVAPAAAAGSTAAAAGSPHPTPAATTATAATGTAAPKAKTKRKLNVTSPPAGLPGAAAGVGAASRGGAGGGGSGGQQLPACPHPGAGSNAAAISPAARGKADVGQRVGPQPQPQAQHPQERVTQEPDKLQPAAGVRQQQQPGPGLVHVRRRLQLEGGKEQQQLQEDGGREGEEVKEEQDESPGPTQQEGSGGGVGARAGEEGGAAARRVPGSRSLHELMQQQRGEQRDQQPPPPQQQGDRIKEEEDRDGLQPGDLPPGGRQFQRLRRATADGAGGGGGGGGAAKEAEDAAAAAHACAEEEGLADSLPDGPSGAAAHGVEAGPSDCNSGNNNDDDTRSSSPKEDEETEGGECGDEGAAAATAAGGVRGARARVNCGRARPRRAAAEVAAKRIHDQEQQRRTARDGSATASGAAGLEAASGSAAAPGLTIGQEAATERGGMRCDGRGAGRGGGGRSSAAAGAAGVIEGPMGRSHGDAVAAASAHPTSSNTHSGSGLTGGSGGAACTGSSSGGDGRDTEGSLESGAATSSGATGSGFAGAVAGAVGGAAVAGAGPDGCGVLLEPPAWDERRPGYADLAQVVRYRQACRARRGRQRRGKGGGEGDGGGEGGGGVESASVGQQQQQSSWGVGLLGDAPVCCSTVYRGSMGKIIPAALTAVLQGKLGNIRERPLVEMEPHDVLSDEQLDSVRVRLEELLRRGALQRMRTEGARKVPRSHRRLTHAQVLRYLPEILP
ncbi:hypothetical protein Agub_g7324, partial [Astrephomene gubernaculifera]